MISESEVHEKVSQGWFKAWFIFEVLGVKEEASRKALEILMDKLDTDNRVKLYKKQFGDVLRVEKPLEGVKEGFSMTCEVELVSKKLDDLAQITIEYGPSAIEIIEPKSFKMDSGEAQLILNTISQTIHQFAAAGAGGIVFIREQSDKK
jgi:hypothetical protein